MEGILKKGDTIKCSKDEIVDIMTSLQEEGIETDFMYEKDGEKGYWLVITKVEPLGHNPYQE